MLDDLGSFLSTLWWMFFLCVTPIGIIIYFVNKAVSGVQPLRKDGGLQNIAELQSLSPVQFEQLIGDQFKRLGYSVKYTAATGDQGVDIFIKRDGLTSVVQCKRYKGTVGQPVIRDLYGTMLHNKAHEAYVITTGKITAQGQQWAKGKPIHLIDGERLMKWLNQYI